MEFPKGLFSGAPQLDTRRALLVIDLQNDFVGPDGKLPIENVPESIPAIAKLATRFREDGEVVWIQTEFDEPQPSFDAGTGSYSILLKEFIANDDPSGLPDINGSPSNTPNAVDIPTTADITTSPESPSPDPEAFLDPAVDVSKRCCMPGTSGCKLVPELAGTVDYDRDIITTKQHYGALGQNPLLLSLRVKMVTEVYLCGSLSNVSVYATALEAVMHGFKVTIVEDCVGFRDGRCHIEAMRQMADMMGAFGITSSELIDDLDGVLSDEVEEATAEDPLQIRLAEAVASTESLTLRPKVEGWIATLEQSRIEEGEEHTSVSTNPLPNAEERSASRDRLPPRSQPQTLSRSDSRLSSPPRKRSISEVDFLEPNARISIAASQHSSAIIGGSEATGYDRPLHRRRTDETATPPVSQPKSENSSDNVQHKYAIHPKPSTSQKSLEIPSADGTSPVDRKPHRKPAPQPLGPGDRIGEGDCEVIYDFIDSAGGPDVFERLNNEVQWQKMFHRSGEVPRLVAVQGQVDADGSIPIYRHPADESPPLLPFSPTVLAIQEAAEEAVGHPLNHVLIQLYRGGQDNISEHSDKTLDIVKGSKILNYSVGAQRNMTLRTKKSTKILSPIPTGPSAGSTVYRQLFPSAIPQPGALNERKTQVVPLPHNSLFILGLQTNKSWMHAIRPDKRPESEKTAEQLAFGGSRISLTFRHIGTWVNGERGLIWGQGGAAKKKEEAHEVVAEGTEEEIDRMIQAFGEENHQGKSFDWERWYGRGFDVINFATKRREEEEG
ncbi:MAG: hypothetical protein Q9227_001452 [Pyrenula ochraceoflavens]